MISMNDIVSWLYLEEEIEMFGDALLTAISNKYRRKDIISDDDGSLFSVLCFLFSMN